MQTRKWEDNEGVGSTSLCSHQVRVWTPDAAGFKAPEKSTILQFVFFASEKQKSMTINENS